MQRLHEMRRRGHTQTENTLTHDAGVIDVFGLLRRQSTAELPR